MNHVTPQLARWLGGELDASESRAVDEHLEGCAACRAEAEIQGALWSRLGAIAEAEDTGSVWSAVRERTLGRSTPWFFGGGSLVRSGLASAAVAGGLALALLIPAGAGTVAAGDDDEAGLWLSGSSWLDEDGAALQDLWLTWDGDEEVES